MSSSAQARLARRAPAAAVVFAALGDRTRLALVRRLCGGATLSVSQLCEGQPSSRQAVSKHLRVLEDARLVSRRRAGRESLYTLDPAPIDDIRAYIDLVSAQWDDALARLQAFVER